MPKYKHKRKLEPIQSSSGPQQPLSEQRSKKTRCRQAGEAAPGAHDSKAAHTQPSKRSVAKPAEVRGQQQVVKQEVPSDGTQQQPGSTAAAAAAATDLKDDEVRRLFSSWAWKREHRPDKDRFQRPYIHTMVTPDSSGRPQEVTLTIKQQRFTSEGFASTVWDSSIVASKYLEKLGPSWLEGKRCLDLSAGCGLVGVVMAKLGAVVTVTDLAPNLPLLQHNCNTNGVPDVAVCEHRWGDDVSALGPPFDVIVACDVMYVDELVQPLLQSLVALSSSSSSSRILVAHGRNRPAEPAFRAAAAAHFAVEVVPGSELDEVYQCSDVDVLRLMRL